jgi:FAD/FMN-containing dehydrogenase
LAERTLWFGHRQPCSGTFVFVRPLLSNEQKFQATIVTADGSILVTNETENPDLFFAIRGGGSNFGVATEFVLRLHPQRRTVYAGHLIFKATDLEKLIDVSQLWYPHASDKEGMLQMITVGPDDTVRPSSPESLHCPC